MAQLAWRWHSHLAHLAQLAGTSTIQRALDNQWLAEQGVPSIRQHWIEMHYGQQNEKFNPQAVILTGPSCQVVWGRDGQPSQRPD